MTLLKRFSVSIILLTVASVLSAQNTNSVYSRYAFGVLENPAMGKARSMGGIGYGFHDNQLLNVLNPASYADVDTLNMLFEFGMSAQMTSFKEGSLRQRNPNGYVDNVGMKFALKPNWGVALGLYQFSKVGYEYHSTTTLIDPQGEDINFTNSYLGSGGLNTVFLGTGFSLFKGLSLGANLNYTFGMIGHTRATNYLTSGINNETNHEYLFLGMPGLDLGLQYDIKLSPKSNLTAGLSFSSFLPVRGELYNASMSTDTVEATTFHDFKLGNTLGVGLTYAYEDRLTLGLDYQYKMLGNSVYMGASDSLKNQTRIAVGVEYLPSSVTSSYLKAIRYRMGFQYSDLYLKSPGQFKSAALTFGFGLPIRRQQATLSTLNLGFELGKLLTPNTSFIQESYYKVSLGVTFNELWFFKMKL